MNIDAQCSIGRPYAGSAIENMMQVMLADQPRRNMECWLCRMGDESID
jgi:hypothetical protein